MVAYPGSAGRLPGWLVRPGRPGWGSARDAANVCEHRVNRGPVGGHVDHGPVVLCGGGLNLLGAGPQDGVPFVGVLAAAVGVVHDQFQGPVKFAPRARTAWHSHGLGQTLYVVEGIALIQSRGGVIIEAHPGDVIYTPPGEEHWHGAAPDHFMIHLALWENPGPDGPPENNWLEHVADDEYNGPRRSTRP